ncbi:MAG TPA: hypothetical protein VF707_05035 [Ardenticatenaceae bacterium]|jgi:hypothetical protein
MKRNIVLGAFFLAALVWMTLPQPSRGQGQGIRVSATNYTCDRHPDNPFRCGVLRWGGDVNAPGMACPVAWKNRVFDVPGYGRLRCDDTGAYDYWNGLPHIDIRVRTWAEAERFGVRAMTIYPAGAAPATQPAQPAQPAQPSQPAQPANRPEAAPPAEPEETQAEAPAPAPSPSVKTPDAAIQLAMNIAPSGDRSTAMARLVRVARAREVFPGLVEVAGVADHQPVWVVTLWVPPTDIPLGITAKPDATAPIAGRFFVFDAEDGDAITGSFISVGVLEKMGSLESDTTISLD